MDNIKALQPQQVWSYFEEILQIPRPSKKEDKIINYLIDFAQKQNLEYKRDAIGNLVIIKPATAGKENLKTTILQSHVDMVCEKNSNVEHDFEKDAIKAYIDKDWIKAHGTTLGADNGIGIAAQLAVLADDTLEHGPVECLFTVDEETGLTGAFNLGTDLIKGDMLLNLDSEDDGEIFIGCAGGIDSVVTYKYRSKPFPSDHLPYEISISGLKGGHSGDDINKGRANSNKLLARILWNATVDFQISLSAFNGGNLRNAIPREASAIIGLPKDQKEKALEYLRSCFNRIREEYLNSEPDMLMEIKSADVPKQVMKKKFRKKLLNALIVCPNGIIEMSQSIPGLVETSTNLASVKSNGKNTVDIILSQRSSIESAKDDIVKRVKTTFEMIEADVKNEDSYPGWKPNTNSPILDIAKKVHVSLFNEEPLVRAIHAGLECGLFLEKYPHLDMISFGPTIKDAHSPDERLHIPAVERFWKLLVELLKNIPEKKVQV